MNRRGFIGAGLAGLASLGGFFFPQKLKASQDRWWKEKDFVFEGVPGTEFLWPSDRFIELEQPKKDKHGRRRKIWVLTFSLRAIGDDIKKDIRDAISAHKHSEGDKYVGSYIHLVRIKGYPNQIGIMIHSGKCSVVTNYWADGKSYEGVISM